MFAIDQVAQRQHGLVTRAQALDHLTVKQVAGWLASGRFLPAARGVFRLAGVPVSFEQRLHAACLAGGGVASHRAAARLLSLPVPSERIEITVPLGRQVRLPGITTHRSNILLDEFCATTGGIPSTTPERTLVDLTAVLGVPTCTRALDDAVRRRLTTYASIDRCYRVMRRRGRRRVAVVEALLAARLDGVGPGDSEWEMRLARWLVQAGFDRPAQGQWVVAGGERFCLDLAYPSQRVAVEFDGWEAHRLRARYDSDRRKWRRLELEGWIVLPFTSSCERAEVVADVRAALRQSSP